MFQIDTDYMVGLSDQIDRYIYMLRTDGRNRERHPSLFSCDVLEMQDENLRVRGFYRALPVIGVARMILPLEGFSLRIPTTTFSDVTRGIPSADVRVIESAILFAKDKAYVNPSRAKLSDTFINHNMFLKASETLDHVICLMTGVVASSSLSIYVAPVLGSTRSLTIQPFAQELRRDTTYWAEKFSQSDVVTTVSDDGVRFQTRPYGVDRTRPENVYMISGLDLYDDIPVYDCRCVAGPFEFSSEFLRKLSVRCRYGKGKGVEIPLGSVVTVGYSLAHSYGRRGSMFIPYLKFVIVLSTPTDPSKVFMSST